MRLASLPVLVLLLQTTPGTQGEVRCGSNSVPNCSFCYYSISEARTFTPDMNNCATSPDCMLNEDSSACISRPQNNSSDDYDPQFGMEVSVPETHDQEVYLSE